MTEKKSGWIWLKNFQISEETEPVFAYFRRELELSERPESFPIRISADSRYKLYINGELAEVGPSKGDDKIWFYDEVETAPYLKKGTNIFAVIVLHYPADKQKGNHSVFQTGAPGLFLTSLEKEPLLKTDGTWKARRASHIHICSENPYFAPLQICERVDAPFDTANWMGEDAGAETWENAWEYPVSRIEGNITCRNLQKRTIPFMRRVPGKFKEVTKLVSSAYSKEEWERFLNGSAKIRIPAHTKECVEIHAGELMTGYLRIKLEKGGGSSLTILQSEAYAVSVPEAAKNYQELPTKGDRTDSRGTLLGFTDFYTVCGKGEEIRPEVYEPFWFRTFRFLRLTVETAEEPLVLSGLDYVETGYPLEIKSKAETSDPSLFGIWEISARTLKRCMHETYEDCPFYEQLQYAMDSRSQILYTYAVSADDRLARKCMDDFRRATSYDGILNCSYPNRMKNLIPGFSIYYIGMLYDHMMYFGDKKLLEEHLPVVEGILDFFHRHLDERGVVEKIGGLNIPNATWSFIDWTPEWDETNGVPSVTLNGPITMESLLYILGLQYAEAIYRYIGKAEEAARYREEAGNVKRAVNTHCRGKNGMYQDGPGMEVYSQHCQVFAILTDTVSVGEGRGYLLETLKQKETYAQCSVAMMYYLFRALEKCDLYERTDELWDNWRVMLKNHMTTCAEDPMKSRSDCHAWGALALYELPSVILGVRPGAPGYEKILINPVPGALSFARGQAVTPKGMVSVSWEKRGKELVVSAEAPEGAEILYRR